MAATGLGRLLIALALLLWLVALLLFVGDAALATATSLVPL